MPEVDDLPKMVSLSPEPLVTMDEKNILAMKLSETLPPIPRHNLDAEVIEALLQQDIDLGLTRHDFDPVRSPLEEYKPVVPEKSARLDDEWLSSKVADPSPEEDTLDRIWAGLDYTVDSETGEYMLVPSAAATATATAPSPVSSPAVVPRGSPRHEPLLSAPIPTTIDDLMGAAAASQPRELPRRLPHASGDSGQGSLDSDSEMALLDRMIEAAGQRHGETLQPRVPLSRMISMEQRWQDLASVLLLPPGQEAPPQQRPAAAAAPGILHAGFLTETGAVGQTMLPPSPPLTLPSTVPAPAAPLDDSSAPGGGLTYFQLSPAAAVPPAQTAAVPAQLDQDDAFLSQLLGVDQMDLSGAPITELAPQDWSGGDQSADSGGQGRSPPDGHSPSSQSGLPGGFNAGRSSSTSPSGPGSDGSPRPPRLPVAQKKHQMYGKRMFQAQDGQCPPPPSFDSCSAGGSPCRQAVSPAAAVPPRYAAEGGLGAAAAEPAEVKYSDTPQFTRMSPVEPQPEPVAHNHSYHQPAAAAAETAADTARPLARDKDKRPSERVSRDEKRLRAMDIPLTADEIVNMSMDEFNERMIKLQLSEAQHSLVRDVRRRGKNKLAAQNCRKRKLDQITSLTEDLQKVRDERQRMLAEHRFLSEERLRIRDKYAQLHRHVFQSLRDADNQPYSPSEYSLQLSADGDVLLVPRGPARCAAVVPPAAVARHKLLGLHQ